VLDWFFGLDVSILGPLIVILIAGAAELGDQIGLRVHATQTENADVSTLAGAALGLLALLVAFNFSMAEARYDARRDLVLQEANAIGSTANFALMLPAPAQQPILNLLRDYTAIRIRLGVSHDASDMARDIARSVELQGRLWQQAVAVAAADPHSLPAYRFVGSLNEVNNIHEARLTALRNHVPSAVLLMLIGTSMVAMGFTGYNAGVTGTKRRLTMFIMSLTITLLIMLIIDLDRPYRGLILVPVQALVDTAQGLPH
jgi:hypothetical protein